MLTIICNSSPREPDGSASADTCTPLHTHNLTHLYPRAYQRITENNKNKSLKNYIVHIIKYSSIVILILGCTDSVQDLLSTDSPHTMPSPTHTPVVFAKPRIARSLAFSREPGILFFFPLVCEIFQFCKAGNKLNKLKIKQKHYGDK